MFFEGLKLRLALQLLLPHCFLETRTQGHSEHPVIAVSGSNVTLAISNLPANAQRLIWYYNATKKILEWETHKRKPHYYENEFKGRVSLDIPGGALHIYNVQEVDRSTYLLKVLLKTGSEEEWSIPLTVLDPVPKPEVKVEKKEGVNNTCHLILLCVVHRLSQDQSIEYTWYGDAGHIPGQLQEGVLEITIQPQNFSKSYTCVVSNAVSTNSSTVYFTPTCKVARSSGVGWGPAWLTVRVPSILGLLLI